MTVLKVNSAQKVVIAQIHVKDVETPPLKVFWNKGKLTMGFRENFAQVDPVNSTVLDNVPLGALLTISIHANATGAVSVSASCNGNKSNSPILRLDDSWATQTLGFHGGVYNRIDYSDTTSADDGSICIISDLSITHT